MQKNIGSVDRILRIVVGVALIAWAIMGTDSWHLLGWIGLVPLLTGLFASCPLYTLFGIKTCPLKKS